MEDGDEDCDHVDSRFSRQEIVDLVSMVLCSFILMRGQTNIVLKTELHIMLTYTYDQFREHPVIRRLIQRNGTVNNYVNEFRKTEKKLLVF